MLSIGLWQNSDVALQTDENCLTCPHSPGTQRGGGQRPKLQRMRTGGLVWLGQWAGGKVLVRSLLLHKAMRCLKPGPHFGVHWGVKKIWGHHQLTAVKCKKNMIKNSVPGFWLTSDQSSVTHLGGQDWLLQDSCSIGRWVRQCASSRVSSSAGPIFLMHRTVLVLIPPSHVFAHSDQSPIYHLDDVWHGSSERGGNFGTLELKPTGCHSPKEW